MKTFDKKIEGVCAYCNEEMELIAGNKDGSEGVCWQCADPEKDTRFYDPDLNHTHAGRLAFNVSLTQGA